MDGKEGLSALDVDSVSPYARKTAQTVLEAYYLQDQRERHLLHGNADAAAETAERALDAMATTHEREFPRKEVAAARAAGQAFMRALFLQDEIENWDRIRDAAVGTLSDVLLTDIEQSYSDSVTEDRRWRTVETYLGEVCTRTGINDAYASRQKEFWLRHGQGESDWETIALEAHELKVQAMVEDVPTDTVEALGNHFVEGVKYHDSWSHNEQDRDIDLVRDIVARYYEKIFQLRSEDR